MDAVHHVQEAVLAATRDDPRCYGVGLTRLDVWSRGAIPEPYPAVLVHLAPGHEIPPGLYQRPELGNVPVIVEHGPMAVAQGVVPPQSTLNDCTRFRVVEVPGGVIVVPR